MKVTFQKTLANKELLISIKDDVKYSEEANNFELEGYLVIDRCMVAFFNLEESENYQENLEKCLIKTLPPIKYKRWGSDNIIVNEWHFKVQKDESLKLIQEGLNKNVKVVFKNP